MSDVIKPRAACLQFLNDHTYIGESGDAVVPLDKAIRAVRMALEEYRRNNSDELQIHPDHLMQPGETPEAYLDRLNEPVVPDYIRQGVDDAEKEALVVEWFRTGRVRGERITNTTRAALTIGVSLSRMCEINRKHARHEKDPA